MATLVDTVRYYQNLLAAQYKTLPRASGTIGIYCKQALADMMPSIVNYAFDINTAVGVQLDIIGKYVGLSRNIGTPIVRPYHDFSDYDGTIRTNGFTDYTNPAINPQAIFYQYSSYFTSNTTLTDEQYRSMLILKIQTNRCDNTMNGIMTGLALADIPVKIVDNLDMSITYTAQASIPVATSELLKILPRPMGVASSIVTFSATAAPSTLSTTLHTASTSPVTATTSASTVTTANGVGPYTYQWSYVSGDTDIVCTTPTASSSTFSLTGTNPITKSAVWKCTVADYRGLTATTNTVAITISIQT